MFSKIFRKLYNFLLIPLAFKNWAQVMGYVFPIYLSNATSKNKTVAVILKTGGKLKIRLVNTLDLGSIIETFQRKVYTPKMLKIPKKAKIIDIGTSISDFSVFCASTFKNCNCFSFEPTRSAFELCRENILLNKLNDRITVKWILKEPSIRYCLIQQWKFYNALMQ